MLPTTAKGACRVLGSASHGLHSICAMVEMRRRLGGCCRWGAKQQTGLQFLSLAAGRDKGPVEIKTLSLLAGRHKKTGARSVVLTPTLQQPPTLHHLSIMGICEV